MDLGLALPLNGDHVGRPEFPAFCKFQPHSKLSPDQTCCVHQDKRRFLQARLDKTAGGIDKAKDYLEGFAEPRNAKVRQQ